MLPLGERVRSFRKAAGLTQKTLAQAANIGRVTLVRLEKGEQSPRFRTLDAVAKALGRRPSELLVEPEFLARAATGNPGETIQPPGQSRVRVETEVGG